MTRDYVLDQGFAEERVALSRGRRRWRVDGAVDAGLLSAEEADAAAALS